MMLRGFSWQQIKSPWGYINWIAKHIPQRKQGLIALIEDPKVEGWFGPCLAGDKISPDPWRIAYRYESSDKKFFQVDFGWER